MNTPMTAYGALDLTNCDREPIHIPGSIQPHGALLTFDPNDLRVLHAGGATIRFFGRPAIAMLGTAAPDLFSPDQHQRLLDLLCSGHPTIRPVHVFCLTMKDGETVDVIAHVSDGLLVLEFEPCPARVPEDPMALVQSMIRHVRQADTLQSLFDAIATEVRHLLGFDHVMIYRFAPDGSGTVVAEARLPSADSFLGLNFPAADIPKQARALYLANWIRTIPDARYDPASIIPPLNPLNEKPLDLSHSVLRSISPVHRQYLANMGVVASLSLSLISRGVLWGLIVCHHHEPWYVPYRLRDVCELFAELTSVHLAMKLIETDLAGQSRTRGVHEDLVARMNGALDLADGLIRGQPSLLDLIPASGGGLWFDGRFTPIGVTPRPERIEALVAWLNTRQPEGVFHTDCLPAVFPAARDDVTIASGLLALSISRTPRDYVLWFRPEIGQATARAGKPPALAAAEPLTPRHGFAMWQEAVWRDSVRMHASPWLEHEVDAAHRLRLALLEVVLRRIDQIARERETARLQRERLSRESDLRLRLDEWRTVADALRQETERRAILEADLSQVLRRTVADQEAERERISRELHDTLGQSLTLLQLGLEGLGRAPANSAEFQDRLTALKDRSTAFGRDLNRMAWEIRPTALDDLGIQLAIRLLAEMWTETAGMQFDLHLTLDGQRLPPDVETTLYRVLQEALTNVVRHAGATCVGVVLSRTDKIVSLIVEDDGRGFVNDATGLLNQPAKRLGLLGIRERLALVNGSLEIESAPGAGTTLFIRIPL